MPQKKPSSSAAGLASTSTSNEAALLLKLKELTGGADAEKTDATWLESLVVTAAEPLACDDPQDDLKRELAFYNQALSAVRVARQRFERLGVPHVRPDDYFAEMLKSDKHMTKVKKRMISEQQSMHQAEERRKQAANKKFGKQVQREKLIERAQKRKRDIAEVTNLRKKRKGGGGNDADFDVSVDEAISGMGGGGRGRGGGKGAMGRGGGGKGGGGMGRGGGKGGMSRKDAKQAKFGKSRFDKTNSSASTADFGGKGGGRGGGFKGGGRGKGGGGRGGGKGGGRGGAAAKAPRPGKDRRKSGR